MGYTVTCKKCKKNNIIVKNTQEFFKHCSLTQRVSDSFPISINNKKKSIDQDSEKISREVISESDGTSDQKFTSNNSTPSVHDEKKVEDELEIEEEIIDSDDNKSTVENNSIKEYKYQCGRCKAMFDEHNGNCPNPKCNAEF